VVSAETSGRLLSVTVEEGNRIEEGATAAVVDTAALAIRRRELEARLAAAENEITAMKAEIDAGISRLRNLQREEARITAMYGDSAVTERELDRIRTERAAMEDQVRSMKHRAGGLAHGRDAIEAKIEMAEENISKSVISSPVPGTVLEKYRRRGELVMPGTPLYKIQDLSELDLRVYVSGAQLPSVRLGDSVDVFIDSTGGDVDELGGEVIWISDSAEFTPKIIQTREVRVDLVYAVRVKVANDGRLKIGMPGEIRFRE
jgi:HlyD family secretion protein